MFAQRTSNFRKFIGRVLLTGAVLAPALVTSGCAALQSLPPEQKAEQLVVKSHAVFRDFWGSSDDPMIKMRELWPQARGVILLPGILKAGFIVGAEGGNGVLLARDVSGNWSQPAFYTLAAGSIGLQAGGQSSDVALLIFSDDAVRSLIEHQGKLGADLGLTVGTLGAGVEASTTTNVGADILAVSKSIGVFAGASLEGAVLVKRNDLNHAFYGQEVSPTDIVLDGRVSHPATDTLRALLAEAR